MALTKTERRLLLRARQRIRAADNSYVCHALSDAVRTKADAHAALRLRQYIGEQLGTDHTLGAWQKRNGLSHSFRQQREDRIAWIDWMLDEGRTP